MYNYIFNYILYIHITIIHMYVYVRPMISPMISEALQGHGRRKRWGAGLVGGARAGDIFYNWLIT